MRGKLLFSPIQVSEHYYCYEFVFIIIGTVHSTYHAKKIISFKNKWLGFFCRGVYGEKVAPCYLMFRVLLLVMLCRNSGVRAQILSLREMLGSRR
jgi:hypothetical protein